VTFPKGDVAALTKRLQSLCDHPETVEACRKTAADEICARYDWDQITKKTLELYE
jgi:glycosyltransferase involved in cell wall biosynthesis